MWSNFPVVSTHGYPFFDRRHAERATPRKLAFGEKLAVVLIEHIGFGGVALDECADVLSFPCT